MRTKTAVLILLSLFLLLVISLSLLVPPEQISPAKQPTASATPNQNLSPEDIEFLKSKGIDPSTASYATPEQMSPLNGAMVCLDSFMGETNTTIAADVISMKPEVLKFRLFGKDFNYSGHYTVMLNTPRQHKNPFFGLSSPETANLVILENVGGDSWPLQNATIWEKSKGFIVVTALNKEWIHSGTYTIQN
jgi:hypothetical protein